jgi:hypothetical protein
MLCSISKDIFFSSPLNDFNKYIFKDVANQRDYFWPILAQSYKKTTSE